MGIDEARVHLGKFGRGGDIIEFEVSSATVELAAKALGVEPGRIAKSLAFGRNGSNHLILFAGDARVDNGKYKARFGMKASMLSAEETFELTGHRIGGVCPFGLRSSLEVWLDESLRRFDVVYPACGSANSAIRASLEELERWSGAAGWVDVAKLTEA
ncbi:MAG TPA: YbaK/EbsC family protein [Rectinemataceae bacterium]|nr:YbaK/EbsC family protein [Rectinemataceae bacterium]